MNMYQAKHRIVNIERYLLYGLILSMATYPIPFLRVRTEETAFPIGGLFIPMVCFLLFIKYFSSKKINLNKILGISLFLLYFSILLSSFFSIRFEIEPVFRLSIFMLLPLLFTGILTNYRDLKTSLHCVILVGLILGIYGFYGYLTGNVGEEAQKTWWWTYARYWGIHYLPSTRNSDVYYVAIPLFVTLTLIFFGNLKSFIIETLLIIISLMFFIGVILSFSRGAWISTFTTFIFLLFMIWKRRGIFGRKGLRLILFTTIIILVSFTALNYFSMYNYFIGKIFSIFFSDKASYYLEEDISNDERIEILKATFNIIVSNPFGIGIYNLRYVYPAYGLYVNHPENTYLHVLAENGIFGFIGYMIFLFYPLVILYKRIKVGPDDWLRDGIFLTLIYLATSYIFNVEIFNFYNWVIHSIIWSSITIYNGGKNGR